MYLRDVGLRSGWLQLLEMESVWPVGGVVRRDEKMATSLAMSLRVRERKKMKIK